MISNAVIDGPYRYRLTRAWEENPRRVTFIMLNPSTADHQLDDPTIRRCLGFARRLDAGVLDVVNLFALRATDPIELQRHADPVGPRNDEFIDDAVSAASVVVAAWGNHGTLHNRSLVVRDRLLTQGFELHALGHTASRQPKHPLYVRADAKLESLVGDAL